MVAQTLHLTTGFRIHKFGSMITTASEQPQIHNRTNQTLSRWQAALSVVERANQQAVWSETLTSRSELLSVLDQIRDLADETRGQLQAVGLA